ncbi:aspartyl/asparaginyl beta-hydroxylase domain-containing protein [Variovorax sp. J22R24]|uniref:aspartyl/asparaginyl beta-hydroxylase domain-containing protein n=1 Tax=Variovorax gracilis TaxID=3053502 RepID=UPI002575B423|nr:aspartyl/asparaginyl beta-hydroxylase domain-containing protein [Variovorax sp. J22R24]MDM0105377.1 aspartyl/asparaginyl beta-hydroxylase domain-containing protein [Variovorax sp. J22R24]
MTPAARTASPAEGRQDGDPSTASAQAWETEGLETMGRPGLATRWFMRGVSFVENLNRRRALLGTPCVYPNEVFPWATKLESEWRTIRSELDEVLLRRDDLPNVQDITPDARSITTDARWKVFVFTAYGVHSPLNCKLCPQTWKLVRQIPGLRTAMFSILAEGKHIPPHRGPYNGVLRLHLALKVPEPRTALGIRIGHERCHWQEGKALIFDDAYEHEVWNDSTGERVVLFIDFERPLPFPAALLNRALLRLAVYTPFLREGGENLRRWERDFHGR